MENNELKHYGILGMKWGIRRYQNYDGSYTKKGLERLGRSKSAYEKADKNLKDKKANGDTRENIRKARRVRRGALYNYKQDYKDLEYHYRADKGKELYRSGKTIRKNNLKAAVGIPLAEVAIGTLESAGKQWVREHGDAMLNKNTAIAMGAVNMGILVAEAILIGKWATENYNLRAYYGHTQDPSHRRSKG